MRLLPRHSGLRPQFYILTLTAGPCTLSGVLHGAFRSCTYHAREEVDGNIVFTVRFEWVNDAYSLVHRYYLYCAYTDLSLFIISA